MFNEKTINSHKEFSELTEEFKNAQNILFRGQQMDWPLLPKISRVDLIGDFFEIENKIIKEFQRRGMGYDDKMKGINNMDLLSKANHHGLPTRILDWTEKIYYALWFCVKEAHKYYKISNGQNYGVLWVLQYEDSDIIDNINGFDPMININMIKIFRPNHCDDRIKNQCGCFTLPIFSVDNNKFIPLEMVKSISKKLTKIRIEAEVFPQLRLLLQKSQGINDESLFRDLDGLCRNITMEFCKQLDDL